MTTTTNCYDSADRLTSSTDATVGAPVYDAHGNTTTLGSQTLAFDGADRHTFGLMGGVVLSKGGPNGDVWSYPNIHGDVMAVANAAGVKSGSTATYDPFGKSLTTAVDNKPGNFDYGWLGSQQRPTEHDAGAATIEMGPVRMWLRSGGS